MLADIHSLRLQSARARDEEAAARAEARDLADQLRTRLEGIEEERRGLLEQARAEAESELEDLRSEIRSLRRRLRAAVAPLDEIASIEQAVDALDSGLPSPDLPEPSALPPAGRSPEKAGDAVFVRTLGVHGSIISIEGDEAVVQIGPARGRFALASLSLSSAQSVSVPSRPRSAAAPPVSPGTEVEVRGLLVDEAIPLVDRHIDAAFRAGLPSVLVIHGKGTGALRRAVRKLLRGHPLVSSYSHGSAAQGGDGATIVELASR